MTLSYWDNSDIELIEQAKIGNGQAFRVLVLRYEKRVARTVMGLLGVCPEADDVGQETFIRFYKSLADFRGEASLGTYLCRIAANLSLNELKRRKKRGWLSFFSPNDDKDTPTQEHEVIDSTNSYEQYDMNEQIQLALERLDEKLRSVVVLRLIEGFSTKETADMLDVPLGTVLSRLSRAQDQLKKHLAVLGR